MLHSGQPGLGLLVVPVVNIPSDALDRQVRECDGWKEMAVTDAVVESTASLVFTQAATRMHTIQALLA